MGKLLCTLVALVLCWPLAARAEVAVTTAVIRVDDSRPLPISRLDLPPDDHGFAGARVALGDNSTTGQFLGHTYAIEEVTVAPDAATAEIERLAASGIGLAIVMAGPETLLAMAEAAAPHGMQIFNASAPDGRLREADCRANVFHIAPSRAMIAEGLAQYLVWKKWRKWLLVHGSHPVDALLADAYRRAARKFGAEIVEERVFEDTGGARRSDSGHVLVQRQMPVFMQRAEDHHVVIVADESDVFGPYLPYRGWDPRPVAGSAGLRAAMWHASHESWGATQLQRRFEKVAGRGMRDLDYQAWLALRSIGEAVTRTGQAAPEAIAAYLRSDAFEIAGFKGQPLSFRPWNNQLRNGVVLTDGRLVVSVSPQDEFLHQRTRLDTLGLDAPESTCRF